MAVAITRHAKTTTVNTLSSCTVKRETFDSLYSYWRSSEHNLHWPCPFVLPPWLQTWWNSFSSGCEPHICTVKDGDMLLGIAPFMVQGRTACFIGSTNVCDYQDCITTPGREPDFFNHLVMYLQKQGIALLDLGLVRPDSSVFMHLPQAVKSLGLEALCTPEDVVVELKLPATWDEFLHQISSKERHEIRRKIRRLEEAGLVTLHSAEHAADVRTAIDIFLSLFTQNRADKMQFMTNQMTFFFRSLAESLAEEHILKLFFLDLDNQPAAAVMCFDYNATVYLYNSGYNKQHHSLSVGLLSKVLSIKNSIQKKKKKYDFLKGAEIYKHRLGGTPVQLYRCQIDL